MKRKEIKVDQLQIRLRNGDLRTAQDLKSVVGGELMRVLGEQMSTVQPAAIRVGSIDAGTARLDSVPRPQAGRAIAHQIAAAVNAKVPRSSGGK